MQIPNACTTPKSCIHQLKTTLVLHCVFGFFQQSSKPVIMITNCIAFFKTQYTIQSALSSGSFSQPTMVKESFGETFNFKK